MSSERYIIGQKCFSGWMVAAGSCRHACGYRPDFARYLIEFPRRYLRRKAVARFTQPGNRHHRRAHGVG